MGAEQGLFATIVYPYFIGEGIFSILVMIYRGMQSYANTGHFWTKKYSHYFYEIPNSGTKDHLEKMDNEHNVSVSSDVYAQAHNDADSEYAVKWINVIGTVIRAVLVHASIYVCYIMFFKT